MKICIIGNPNSVHVRRWASNFILRSHSVHLIGEHKPTVQLPEGIIFHDLTKLTNTRKLRYVVWAFQIRRILESIKPDILHAQGVVSAGWLGAASGYHPFLISAHGSDLLLIDQRDWLNRALTKWTLLKADYVTCVSENLAIKAKTLGVKPEHTEVLYLGVNLELFHPSSNPQSVRRRLGLGSEPLVLSIRGMRSIYNILDIAKAIPLVLDQVPNAHFIIFSYNIDPEYLSRVRAKLSELVDSGHVIFVENLVDDIAISEYYQACDVAVSVPSSDGTPQSVLEAMACGVPVLVSGLSSLSEWVTHEKEGLLVPTGDIQAIGQSIIRLLLNENLRRHLGQNACEKIRRQADLTRWEQRAEDLYLELLR